MDSLTEAYLSNPDACVQEVRAAHRDLVSLFDVNVNFRMEMDEHVRLFKVLGHFNDSADMASFKVAYNNTDSVPFDVVIDTLTQFRTGTATTAQNDTIDEAIKTALREEL